MQFLNLEYKTRPAPQAVKRKKEKKRRSETNLMQCARPDDADGDEGRAGTPRERGREGEGGEADDNGSNHNDGNKSKRQQKEGEKGKRTKSTTGQRREGQPRAPTTRYTGLNLNHSDCSETAHSSQKISFSKFS